MKSPNWFEHIQVGKNNLCAGGMLSVTIEYNVWGVAEVRVLDEQQCPPAQM